MINPLRCFYALAILAIISQFAEGLPQDLDDDTISYISSAISSPACSSIDNVDNHSTQKITEQYLSKLENWSKMVDNSYCVGAENSISEPFTCDAWCSEYPEVELVYKWSGQGTFSATGFIALDHATKTVLLIIRGTRSLRDIITDLRVRSKDMTKMKKCIPDVREKILDQCPECEVHSGFMSAFLQSYKQVKPVLYKTLDERSDYRLFVGGHSLGGAIAILYGLTLKLQTYDPIVFSMAQPRVGNAAFANFLDVVFFGKCNPTTLDLTDTNRRLFRLTHYRDPVPRVPAWGDYRHSSGEIYIGDEGGIDPSLDQVWTCNGQENVNCVSGGDLRLTVGTMKQNHNNYFIHMSSRCGSTLKDWYNGRNP
ncbi:alpha/beta-hydrolase [Nadsonia fulvescens var. elongata DSM 6958]|uniref:triacylglycerol lipase n=1 Tax=Nadsonia fulvescens var. elongata DSM 6958 TaxID=857566 RepID=A0A1E3PCK2_9ASCO|nr:alpha/beta-hydrolase [Nadsonia fulvescens var. elongata DSM 6958]